MSKLQTNKISFDDADFLVEVDSLSSGKYKKNKIKKNKNYSAEVDDFQFEDDLQENSDEQLTLNRAKQNAQDILEKAQQQAGKVLAELEEQKVSIIENAQKDAQEIIENAKANSEQEANLLIEKSKDEIEQERIITIKTAYDEGYKDGLEKIQQELEEKIENFNNFCLKQYEIRDKILKSANKDILDLIINITRKILFKEIDAQIIKNIIQNAISLLEKKENVQIILSEKYARLLYEFQKNSLSDEKDFEFSEFKKYENFDVVYNSNFDDDTIIVENLKERYDASVGSQLDVIIRNIYDNSQNGKIDLDDYENEAE